MQVWCMHATVLIKRMCVHARAAGNSYLRVEAKFHQSPQLPLPLHFSVAPR